MLHKLSSAKTKSSHPIPPIDIRVERVTLNQLTRVVLNSIPYGIIAFDAKGKVIVDNKKHWLINVSDPNPVQKDGIESSSVNAPHTLLNNIINHPALKENGIDIKLKELIAGKSFEMILPNCRNILGKTVALHLTGVPIVNSSSNIVGGILVVDDVTRYLKEDNRLRTQKQLYKARVNSLPNTPVIFDNENKGLTTNPLFQRGIEKLNILQELVKGIGNELRNPLSAIKKSTDFLDVELGESTQFRPVLDTPRPFDEERSLHETNKIRRHLSIITQEIDACNKLINDFMEFVQTLPPEKTKVALREAIDDALQVLTIPMPPTVKIIIDFPQLLPCLYVDRHQIKQALANIITHSVSGMLSGGKLIFSAKIEEATQGYEDPEKNQNEHAMSPESRCQKYLVLNVSDTGIGIPNQKLPKLFHSLFARKTRGIDLGLVVARYLVETNGGKIKMKIIPGIGTTFLVLLPMFEDDTLKN